MSVSYDKFFHMIIDRKIINVQLKDKAGISVNTITFLKRDDLILIESVEKIWNALACGVDDILKFILQKEGVSDDV